MSRVTTFHSRAVPLPRDGPVPTAVAAAAAWMPECESMQARPINGDTERHLAHTNLPPGSQRSVIQPAPTRQRAPISHAQLSSLRPSSPRHPPPKAGRLPGWRRCTADVGNANIRSVRPASLLKLDHGALSGSDLNPGLWNSARDEAVRRWPAARRLLLTRICRWMRPVCHRQISADW